MNDFSCEVPIDTASVKVMRSHDYCHFEVCLSATVNGVRNAPAAVDELRKTAARLADKAVEQYKTAKQNVELLMRDKQELESILYRHQETLAKPEAEWTPKEKATAKAIADRKHRDRPRYDYEDDFEEQEYDKEDDEVGF